MDKVGKYGSVLTPQPPLPLGEGEQNRGIVPLSFRRGAGGEDCSRFIGRSTSLRLRAKRSRTKQEAIHASGAKKLLDCFGAPRLAMTLYRAKRIYRCEAATLSGGEAALSPRSGFYQQLNS